MIFKNKRVEETEDEIFFDIFVDRTDNSVTLFGTTTNGATYTFLSVKGRGIELYSGLPKFLGTTVESDGRLKIIKTC